MPPTNNPIRWCAQKRVHWRGHEEITPGYWLVEEGSGPKANVRRLAVVKQNKYGDWCYKGWVQTYSQFAQLELWLGDRTWKIGGPSAELCPMLTELVRKYA